MHSARLYTPLGSMAGCFDKRHLVAFANCTSIHNFNDSFLIGLNVCQFLCDSLQQHLPIKSVVKVLEGQL